MNNSDQTTHQAETVLPGVRLDEAEGQVFGRYKLLENLDEGGFGTVWLAEQKESVRRKVALKIIKLGMDTKRWSHALKPSARPWQLFVKVCQAIQHAPPVQLVNFLAAWGSLAEV
jgi:serine/threonine protein kinase